MLELMVSYRPLRATLRKGHSYTRTRMGMEPPDATVKHAPSVRQHEYIATHLDEKYSREGYPMTMITAIAMEHDDGRSCRRKLSRMGR